LYEIKGVFERDAITASNKQSHRVGRIGMCATPFDVGYPMLFYYHDEQKAFCTTTIQYASINGSLITVTTQNSVYVLEKL
jgi:hypothetical protein